MDHKYYTAEEVCRVLDDQIQAVHNKLDAMLLSGDINNISSIIAERVVLQGLKLKFQEDQNG